MLGEFSQKNTQVKVCAIVLVQIAGKVAAPLAQTNEIVILSGDGSRVTGEVNRLLAELPVSVNALTGVDLMKVRGRGGGRGSFTFQGGQ